MSDRMGSDQAANLRQQAEQKMRQKEFAAAISLLEQHLEGKRDDLRGLMELGICHLLNGAEEPFRRIYEEVGGILGQARDLPTDVKRLWEHYSGLFVKVSSTALVVGAMATLGACQSSSGETPKASASSSTGGQAPVVVTPPLSSSHRYSGGVYIKPQVDTQPTQPSTKPSTQPVPPMSSHKYSGGVYIQPDYKN